MNGENIQPEPATPSSEVQEGRTFAILSYVFNFFLIPFFIVPLIMRNNSFSLYHAKQNLILWLAGIAVLRIGSILVAVCIGFVILPAAAIALLVLLIFGLVYAVRGEYKPVPWLGKLAEDWFRSLKKTE